MNPLRTTEMTTLARCEQQWWYRYVDGIEDPPTEAMSRGTLWHAAWDEWWAQRDGWYGVTESAVLNRIPEDRHADISDRVWDDVQWMMGRYDKWRGGSHLATDWRVMRCEVELEAEIGDVLFQGRCDDIRLHVPTNKLYIGECKTMRDWRRLDILEVDPQITNYVALARKSGYDVVGVFYDAAKTYRWSRDEHKHPPSDSFRELTLLRDKPQLRQGAFQIIAADRRRRDLVGGDIPMRNISANTCGGCSFRDKCYEDLAFPQGDIQWSE